MDLGTAGTVRGRKKVTRLPLTRRQRQILDWIATSIRANGYAPSLAEIGQQFELTSLATVHKHLVNLQEKGFIKRAWNRRRHIEVLEQRTGPPCPLCGQPTIFVDSESLHETT